MTPFFSIIIPVYNIAPYLRECLDSVLAQTFTDWEAICVNDGSTDGSGVILDEYGARDARFKIIHQANAGVGAARNKGLDAASGTWIWFVDGDDLLRECALQDVVKAICGNMGVRTVRLDCLYGEVAPKSWPKDDAAIPEFFAVACDEGLRRFFFGMWSMILSRETIGSLRLERYPRGEDTVFLLACAGRGFGCVDLRKKLYLYRQRPGSATHIVPTIDIVAKNFACQQKQVENFVASLRLLGNPPAPSSWALLFGLCYETYFGMYFMLSAKDRSQLIENWISLLESFAGHYKPPVGIRIRIAVIKTIRSGFLVGYLAHGHIPGLSKVLALIRRLRT